VSFLKQGKRSHLDERVASIGSAYNGKRCKHNVFSIPLLLFRKLLRVLDHRDLLFSRRYCRRYILNTGKRLVDLFVRQRLALEELFLRVQWRRRDLVASQELDRRLDQILSRRRHFKKKKKEKKKCQGARQPKRTQQDKSDKMQMMPRPWPSWRQSTTTSILCFGWQPARSPFVVYNHLPA